MRRFVYPLAAGVVVASVALFVVSPPAAYRAFLEPGDVDPDLASENGIEECEDWSLTTTLRPTAMSVWLRGDNP